MQRGGVASIDENECLRWLAMKKSSSVLYICFGSMSKTDFSAAQLFEIANALTASGQNFIWAVKNGEKTKDAIRNVDLKWPAARSVDMLNIKAAPCEGSRLE
ncbi:hypothetical protein D5086_002668 [Populus alba]|uniref:Uncharacterized protein n=1 Tax=Populus alba TaxID=43335 RepID=A0ACC4D254_POPAL